MPPFAIAPIPSVQVPMSVTSATRARRAPKKQASAPVPRTWIRISSVRRLAVPFAHDRPKDVLVERVGVSRLGETPRGDVFDVRGERPRHLTVKIRVLLYELSREAVGQAEQVVRHEDLAAACGPGAASDRGDGEAARDEAGEPGGGRFEGGGGAARRPEGG